MKIEKGDIITDGLISGRVVKEIQLMKVPAYWIKKYNGENDAILKQSAKLVEGANKKCPIKLEKLTWLRVKEVN